jgi:hypothetical protein
MALLPWLHGCEEAQQPQPQARARKPANYSSHYIQKYAEKELGRYYSEDDDTKVSIGRIKKEGSHWRIEATITEQGKMTHKRLLVDSGGKIVLEE